MLINNEAGDVCVLSRVKCFIVKIKLKTRLIRHKIESRLSFLFPVTLSVFLNLKI